TPRSQAGKNDRQDGAREARAMLGDQYRTLPETTQRGSRAPASHFSRERKANPDRRPYTRVLREPLNPKRRKINRRRLLRRNRRDDLARNRRFRQPQMRVPERVKYFRRALQAADRRHEIGQGWPRSDPAIRVRFKLDPKLIDPLPQAPPLAFIPRRIR